MKFICKAILILLIEFNSLDLNAQGTNQFSLTSYATLRYTTIFDQGKGSNPSVQSPTVPYSQVKNINGVGMGVNLSYLV